MNKSSVSVFLVDDQKDLYDSLQRRFAVSKQVTLVGAEASIRKGVDRVLQLGPSVVLMDLDFPREKGVDGLWAIREIHKRVDEADRATPSIIIWSQHPVSDGRLRWLPGAIRAGACGFVSKTGDSKALVEAILRVHSGEDAWEEIPLDTLEAARKEFLPTDLTVRKWGILKHLVTGESRKHIAAQFGVAGPTIDHHVKDMHLRVGVTSDAELVRWATERGVEGVDQLR